MGGATYLRICTRHVRYEIGISPPYTVYGAAARTVCGLVACCSAVREDALHLPFEVAVTLSVVRVDGHEALGVDERTTLDLEVLLVLRDALRLLDEEDGEAGQQHDCDEADEVDGVCEHEILP